MKSKTVFILTNIIIYLFIHCKGLPNHVDNDSNYICENKYPDKTIQISTHSEWTKTHYPKRIEEFKANPLNTGDIVFLGNSITEQGGNWALKIENPNVKNRGISGDTTDGVLVRLGEITCSKSSKVFLMIGINDLFRDDMTSQMVYDNIIKIINQIKINSPNTAVFVQTILPTNQKKLIEKIKSTNNLLIQSESIGNYKMIHLHELFVNNDNLINMQYSNDGVHLNEKGYSVWVNKVKTIVNQ